MSRSKRWLLIYIPGCIVALMLFLYSQNNWIGITTYKIASDKLPDGFGVYRILHLSDLQSKEFGNNQRPLIAKVKKLKPDIIVMTGDLVDSTHYDAEASLNLVLGVLDIAPVYMVRGNHEFAVRNYPDLEQKLITAGARVLRNANERIPVGDGYITLAGVDDPIFNRHRDGDVDKMNHHLEQALGGGSAADSDSYTILLSHRPELFDVYVGHRIDLSLTGHAHGGQIRIPLVGGMYAPGQGSWPQYAEGIHDRDGYAMIVNRGLGNSIFPQRIFNRPEIVVIELSREQ